MRRCFASVALSNSSTSLLRWAKWTKKRAMQDASYFRDWLPRSEQSHHNRTSTVYESRPSIIISEIPRTHRTVAQFTEAHKLCVGHSPTLSWCGV